MGRAVTSQTQSGKPVALACKNQLVAMYFRGMFAHKPPAMFTFATLSAVFEPTNVAQKNTNSL